VTALSDFAICARRFELGHLFHIAEPRLGPGVAVPAREDPRALGSAAHRVLEAFPSERWGTPVSTDEVLLALAREGLDPDAESSAGTARGIAQFLAGAYARSVQRDGSRIARELALGIPFRSERAQTVEVPPPAPPSDGSARSRGRRVAPGQLELFALRPRTNAPDPELLSATVVLKATLDLVIERADGSIDVIDYKRSRGGDEDRYSFQLAAYREAAQRHYGTERVRTGLVHLLADDNEPDWQTPPAFDFFELGTRLVEARFHDAWPGIAEPACRKAQCGFVSACHGPSSGRRQPAT
jgi:ATP-dependent exoDNAse (exonuclease V) beta subunit